MQRMGAAARGSSGEVRSYGDDAGHYQLLNPSAAITAGTNSMFTVPVVKTGRYVFEGFIFVGNTLNEVVTLGVGMTYPGSGAMNMAWTIPSGAFNVAGAAVAYNFSNTNGNVAATVNVSFAANDLRPLWIYGGLRITEGTQPGEIELVATKTSGAGTLTFGTYSRFFVQSMEPQ